MRRAPVAALALCAACGATTAYAHQGNPNYRSNVRSILPATPGLTAQILNFDDSLDLINHSGKTVVVYGYQHEPYLRILGNGTVQVNQRSPARFLNDQRFETVAVPASADPKAAPVWRTVDRTASYTWHDHRVHWMSTSLPPQVRDRKKRTKVFDWKVPASVGGRPASIRGTLFWQPRDEGGVPAGAIAGFAAFVLLSTAFVAVVRRRRAGADAGDPLARDSGEAW
jgi:hypothetical protein